MARLRKHLVFFVTCAKSKSSCHDSCDRDAFVMAMVSLCSSHHCLCVPCVDACLEGLPCCRSQHRVVVVAMRCGNQCHDFAMLLPCQPVVTMCSFTIICSRHALARCCHAFPMVTLPRLAYCPGAPTSSKSSTSKFAASEGFTRGASMWRPLSPRFLHQDLLRQDMRGTQQTRHGRVRQRACRALAGAGRCGCRAMPGCLQ